MKFPFALEKRLGENDEIVLQKLREFATSKRKNDVFDLSSHIQEATAKKSRLQNSSSVLGTPTSASLSNSFTPNNSNMRQSNNTSSQNITLSSGFTSLSDLNNNSASSVKPPFLDNLFLDYSNLNEVFHGRFGYPCAGEWIPKEPVMNLHPVLQFLSDLKHKVNDQNVHFFADMWLSKLDPFTNSTDTWKKFKPS